MIVSTETARLRLMVEFDIKCRECGKPITLRVRDQQARDFFEKDGAFCEACYRTARQPARTCPVGQQG
jgi:hypothetical protein